MGETVLTMMKHFLHRAKGVSASNAPRRTREEAGARPRVSLLHYAVLGFVALGVLPAASADAPLLSAQAQKTDAGVQAGVRRPAKVNMAPFRAFLSRSRRLKEQGKLDLSKPRTLIVEGDRQEDGTLANVNITGASAADPNFRRVAQDFVAAVNESRALSFLDGVTHMRMVFALDAERFRAETASDTPTEARASEMASGYRMMVNFGRVMKRGTDEGVVLNHMKVSASGKQLLMTLDMPREAIGNILHRQVTPN
jgi:hypothetical protein